MQQGQSSETDTLSAGQNPSTGPYLAPV